jgi:hypothetical protein
VELSLVDPARPVFTAPAVGCEGAEITFKANVDDGFGGVAETILVVNIANLNNAPVANAGPNQSVPEGASVAVDAAASSDPDGDSLAYSWTQISGPSVAITGAGTSRASFTAPMLALGGDPNASLLITLQVTALDSCGGASTDFVDVKVQNVDHAPIANAGGSLTRFEGDLVILSGSGSDPDGDSLSYSWRQIAGPAVVLSGGTGPTPKFVAPFTGPDGDTIILELTATDSYGGQSKDTATIAVLNHNTPPDASKARPSDAILWPPNHSLIPITILGIQDPDNNAGIIITSVTQDEPVNGNGDGDTGPDAVLRGNTVLLRAERSGGGNGRVYHIHFTTSDPEGSAHGVVTVSVPKNKKSDAAVDGGELYNSAP